MAGAIPARSLSTGVLAVALPRAVCVVLGCLIAAQVASIVASSLRQATPAPAPAAVGDPLPLPVPHDPQAEAARISAAHLFARAISDLPPQPTRAPLLLKGTFASRAPTRGFAIVAGTAGVASLVRAGAPLPDGSVLQEVHADRVILLREGQREILAFAREANPAGAAGAAAAAAAATAAANPSAAPLPVEPALTASVDLPTQIVVGWGTDTQVITLGE